MKKTLLMAAMAAFTYSAQAHPMTPLADSEMSDAAGESAYSSPFLAMRVKDKLGQLINRVQRAPTTHEMLQLLSEVGSDAHVRFKILGINNQQFDGKSLVTTINGKQVQQPLPTKLDSIGCNVLDLDGNQVGKILIRGLSSETEAIDIAIR